MDFTNKQFGTKMLQITLIIPFFRGISYKKNTETARYHDATNNRYHLHFSSYLPWNSSKRLSTTMLQITCFISFFSLYFPWKSPKRLGTVMLQITDCYLHASSYYPSKSSKRLSTSMLQLTYAISNFSCYFPWISPKQLSTIMLLMTRIILFFRSFCFHASHQSSSAPWCYK